MKQPPITSVRAALLQSLDTAFDKLSWHGTNLTGAIRGLNSRTAARQIRGRKSVWQQVSLGADALGGARRFAEGAGRHGAPGAGT